MKRSREAPEALQQIGYWQVVAKIGHGGCAEVFEVRAAKGKVVKVQGALADRFSNR